MMDSNPICYREYRNRATGGGVTVALWMPRKTADHQELFSCKYSVIGLEPDKIIAEATGCDPLQAAFHALYRIENLLDKHACNLVWLDEPGSGFPAFIDWAQGDRCKEEMKKFVAAEVGKLPNSRKQ
jgi:Domain of unknown function (DUF6968)